MSIQPIRRITLALALFLIIVLSPGSAAHDRKAGTGLGLSSQVNIATGVYDQMFSLCPPGCACLTVAEAEAQFGSGSLKSCSSKACGNGWIGDHAVEKFCYGAISSSECIDTDGGKDYQIKGEAPTCVDQCSEFSDPATVLKECYAEVVDGQCQVKIDYHSCNSACADGRCLAPTCDDWIENQNEADVDCEGPCDQECVCPSGYKCATTAAADEHFGKGAYTAASNKPCDTGPADGPKDDKFCYKKIESYDCVDTDGGADVYTKGSAPGCEDRCVDDQELLECIAISSIDGCETRSSPYSCEGPCVDGACVQASCDDGIQNQDEISVDCSRPSIYADCDSCCSNGIRDFDEEGVDCGGSNCMDCGYTGVKGRILYEDADPDGGGPPPGGRFKPARNTNLYVRLCPDDPCTTPTAQAAGLTDSLGYFNFLVPNAGFKSAFIRLGHEDDDDLYRANYAVTISRDLDDCHELVWWHTPSRTLPSTGGFINFGDLRVGKGTNLEFVGRWREETDAVTCGGGDDEKGSVAGGAEYFNIADVILHAREYANARRGDNDAVSYVDVEWPEPSSDPNETSHYIAAWEEITLMQGDAYEDGTIVHEYAHYLQDAIGTSDDYWGSSEHSFCTSDKDEEFAWKEGFAEYLGTVIPFRVEALSEPATSFGRMEGPYCFETSGLMNCCNSPGEESEATVAAVLWDLADDLSFTGARFEGHDSMTNGENIIFQIFDNELDNGDSFAADAPDLCEFIEQGFNCRANDVDKNNFRSIWQFYSVNCSSECDD